jgi:hypothetical protein
MNLDDISFFFFFGLLLDICILVGCIRFLLDKTTDNQKHAFGIPVLVYLIGFLSGAILKRKPLFSTYILILCILVHFLTIILVNFLLKKKKSKKNKSV